MKLCLSVSERHIQHEEWLLTAQKFLLKRLVQPDHRVTYSNYKHHNSAKGLVGITPAGAVSFVSDLYTGKTSDKQATADCGIISMVENGDSIIADKGFDIESSLPKGVLLNIPPPFLRGKDHLEIEEEQETRKISSVRIHVERAIARIKTFRIFSTVFPLTMAAELNKMCLFDKFLTSFDC